MLVVTDAEDGGVDVDYERSNANLDKLFADAAHGHPGRGLHSFPFLSSTSAVSETKLTKHTLNTP